MSSIVMAFLLNSGNYLYFTFAFLVEEQKYECRFGEKSLFQSCGSKEICPALDDKELYPGFEHRVDVNNENYIKNWY